MDPNGCTQTKGTARKTSQKPARILRRLGENAEASEPISWVLTPSTHSLGDQSTPRRNRWAIHNLQKRFGDSSGATRRLGRLRKPYCNVSPSVSSASPGMSSGRKWPGSTRAAQLQTSLKLGGLRGRDNVSRAQFSGRVVFDAIPATVSTDTSSGSQDGHLPRPPGMQPGRRAHCGFPAFVGAS